MRQLTSAICLGIASLATAHAASPDALLQSAKEMNAAADAAQEMLDSNIELADSLASDSLVFEPVVVRDLPEILASLPDSLPELPYNPVVGPRVFSGYRSLKELSFEDMLEGTELNLDKIRNDS